MAGKFETPRGRAGTGRPPSGQMETGRPLNSRTGTGQPPRRRRRRRRRIQPLLLIPAAVGILIMALVLTMCGKKEENQTGTVKPETTAATEATEPEFSVTARATVASQGDLLMHATIFAEKWDGGCYMDDGTYNFDSLFQYISPYTSAADCMVANLETTLGGSDFPYQGNPSFNCPDAILDSLEDAGYDILLTANNHCYDTLMTGLTRTVQQVRGKGMNSIGTRLSENEPRYAVVDVNGIKLGMTCYTYTMVMDGGKPRLNNNSQVENPALVNYFSTDNLTGFYTELESVCADMKAQGAEATIVYIHWGTEYEITEDDTQRAMAQKLCDMGVDVIIGGHPHVVQPMDLLTSTADPEHKTVCIYSLGNAVSNQRIEEMKLKTGHTEDGVLFSVTFEKYSDGTVAVAEVEVLPTWVNKFVNARWKYEYNILPLDQSRKDQWKTLYSLTDEQLTNAQSSYNRTMEILSPGLTKCRTWLEQARLQREQRAEGTPAAA